MPAKTERKGLSLRHLEACFQPLTATHEPIANVIDDNVHIYVLSHILGNFQGVAEMVLDCLPMNVWTLLWFLKVHYAWQVKLFCNEEKGHF